MRAGDGRAKQWLVIPATLHRFTLGEDSTLKHSGKPDMASRHLKIELAVKATLVAAQGLAIVHAQEAPQDTQQQGIRDRRGD